MDYNGKTPLHGKQLYNGTYAVFNELFIVMAQILLPWSHEVLEGENNNDYFGVLIIIFLSQSTGPINWSKLVSYQKASCS